MKAQVPAELPIKTKGNDTPVIAGLAILMGFQLAGHWLVSMLGVGFAGPLLGMLLLLLCLRISNSTSAGLSMAACKLIALLGLFFLPASSAIVTFWPILVAEGVALVTGLTANMLMSGKSNSRAAKCPRSAQAKLEATQ